MSEIENGKNIFEEYEELIKNIGLEIKTTFIPFSVSRNSNEKHKSLNWLVTLSVGNKKMTFDYSKGIGHLPYPDIHNPITNASLNVYQKRIINETIDLAVETGIAKKIKIVDKNILVLPSHEKFPTPTLQEVLHSLCLGSDVRHYLTFEQWAYDFGYDPDSRKAEKIYEELKKETFDFINLIGSEDKFNKLCEILYKMENQSINVSHKPKM
jgi:hypothetical protein